MICVKLSTVHAAQATRGWKRVAGYLWEWAKAWKIVWPAGRKANYGDEQAAQSKQKDARRFGNDRDSDTGRAEVERVGSAIHRVGCIFYSKGASGCRIGADEVCEIGRVIGIAS